MKSTCGPCAPVIVENIFKLQKSVGSPFENSDAHKVRIRSRSLLAAALILEQSTVLDKIDHIFNRELIVFYSINKSKRSYFLNVQIRISIEPEYLRRPNYEVGVSILTEISHQTKFNMLFFRMYAVLSM